MISAPARFRDLRAKSLYRVIDDRAEIHQFPLLSVSIHKGVIRRDSVTDDLPRAEDLSSYKICNAGDIVLNRMRAFQGAIGIARERGLVSPDYLVLRPHSSVNGHFLHHLFRSSWFVGEMIARLRGIGSTGQGNVRTPRINSDDLGDIRIGLPSVNEQRRIADFLDAEARKTDALISGKLKLLSLLEERIDSRILEHVGASQLGESGSGTPVLPIRRVLSKLSRPAVADEEMITAFRDGQVTARSARRTEGYTLPSAMEAQGQHVELNDIVIHGLDGFAGAIGTSEAVGNCSPVYHVCVPRKGGNSIFFGRLLRVLAVSGYLGLFAISTRERAVDFRNWDLFGRIPIPDVPLREQEEIGASVISTRPLRAAVERSNARAEERFQALITAAVTGQIDVSTASGRGIED